MQRYGFIILWIAIAVLSNANYILFNIRVYRIPPMMDGYVYFHEVS